MSKSFYYNKEWWMFKKLLTPVLRPASSQYVLFTTENTNNSYFQWFFSKFSINGKSQNSKITVNISLKSLLTFVLLAELGWAAAAGNWIGKSRTELNRREWRMAGSRAGNRGSIIRSLVILTNCLIWTIMWQDSLLNGNWVTYSYSYFICS